MDKDYHIIKRIDVEENENKKKLESIIFARVCCTLGITIYHYFCHSNSNYKFLYNTTNSTWGFMLSTTFFCISGTILYYNYPLIYSIKTFYYKRWKRIFPSYYICFTFFYLNRAFTAHKFFFKGHWTKILYSIIGLDSYLSYKLNTYYIAGEWFLGAIIIIYLLYPLILWIINKNIILIFFILIIGYYIMFQTNFFIISKDMNIITCVCSFCFGIITIITIKYKNIFFDKHIIFIISISLLIFFNNIQMKVCIIIFQLQGFSLFLILIKLGKYIMKMRNIKILNFLNNLSYSIFLYHHNIIYDILGINNPEEWYKHLILLLITFILTIICSLVHSMVIKSIFKSEIFIKLDSFFISL